MGKKLVKWILNKWDVDDTGWTHPAQKKGQ
jgi:hypothetical protein